MYYTYIIFSITKRLYYKGISSDLEKRLAEHNADKSRYTSGKGPWQLVYFREFETKKAALIEERRLKRLNHEALERLINSGR